MGVKNENKKSWCGGEESEEGSKWFRIVGSTASQQYKSCNRQNTADKDAHSEC